MQFLVLFVGILVFVFFLFVKPPIHFNQANLDRLEQSAQADTLNILQGEYDALFSEKKEAVTDLITAMRGENEGEVATAQAQLQDLQQQDLEIRNDVRLLIDHESDGNAKTQDTDYVFITYVINYLPIGLVGLLLAVIFSAAMSSTSSELNALATTTVIDLYKRSLVPGKDDDHYLKASKWFTFLWGVIALLFAVSADLFDNLIEAVNIIGSLFYGAILGVFLVAFFLKNVQGRAVFLAAITGEIAVLVIFTLSKFGYFNLAYLWLNLIGCIIVMVMALLIQQINGPEPLVDSSS